MAKATAAPHEMGLMYDQLLVEFTDMIFGVNFHFGYWDTISGEDADGTFEDATDRLTDQMIHRLDVSPGMRVLDVGCGVGGPAVRLARSRGVEVVGITVSHEELRRATALAEAEGFSGQVSFLYCDAMELPFPIESFDAAWALDSLCNMPDRLTVLRKIAETLRPGGRLVLTDTYERSPISPGKRPALDAVIEQFRVRPMARVDEYPRLLQEAGLLFHEQTDLSDHAVRPTFVHMAERIHRNRRDLENRFGAEMVALLDPTPFIDIWEMGYLVAVGRRPQIDCNTPRSNA